MPKASSGRLNRDGFIFTGVERKHPGPVVDPGAGVRATGIGIQHAAVTNAAGGADQEFGAESRPLGPKGVKRCHAGNSSGVVFRKRNAIRNITISHRGPQR